MAQNNVIYFVQRSDGAIKIGVTGFLKTRLRFLKYEHGDIKLLGIMEGSRKKELAIHAWFFDSKLKGEWFKETDSLLQYIIDNTTLPEEMITIRTAMRYTGLSRQTLMSYIASGRLTGRKTGDATSPWLIPADEVEKLRQRRIKTLREKIDAISKPVFA